MEAAADFRFFVLATLGELNDLRIGAHTNVGHGLVVAPYRLWRVLLVDAGPDWPAEGSLELLGALRVELGSCRRLVVLESLLGR